MFQVFARKFFSSRAFFVFVLKTIYVENRLNIKTSLLGYFLEVTQINTFGALRSTFFPFAFI